MKRSLVIGILAATCLASQAQEKPQSALAPTKPDVQITAPPTPKGSLTGTNLIAAPTKLPKEPTVQFGGLATDVKRSTNRWRMFSLRRPADPKNDGANIIRDTRTEAGGPVKLFSVDF